MGGLLKYLFLITLMGAGIFCLSQPSQTDSLKKLLQNARHDSVKLRLFVSLSDVCNEEEILSYTVPALALANNLLDQHAFSADKNLKTKILNLKALALNNTGIYYRQISKLDSAMHYYRESMTIREETGNKRGIVESLNNIGDVFSQQGNFPMTIDYYLRGLKILEENGMQDGLTVSYHNIAYVYLQQNDIDKALEFFNKSLKNSEHENNKLERGFILSNLGHIYNQKKDSANAMKFYRDALKNFEEVNYKRGIATAYTNIGAVYYNLLRDREKGAEYYTKAIDLWEEVGDLSNLSAALSNLSAVYFDNKKVERSVELAERALVLARQAGFPESIKRAAQQLSILYKSQRRFKEALGMRELFIQMRDSIFNEETQKFTFKQQAKYEYEKQQALSDAEHQKELELAEEGKKRQRLVMYTVAFGLLLVLFFSVIIFNRLRLTQKQKKIIEEQKKTVDRKNKHITDSINYAKRIQDSILPSRRELASCFPEHFIFYRPREIVSGDFYWVSRHGEKIIFAVADCTGHGVPGAFMSMIGNTLLNEIVNGQKIFRPSEILSRLNDGIIQALHQDSRAQDDGMDISICLFENNKIFFAGANHSLFIKAGDSLQEVRGDIYSIGSVFSKKNHSFSEKEIDGATVSALYFSTDGFPDQMGGMNGKKILFKKLQELLNSVSHLDINEQEEKIKTYFEDWKGNYAQLDDVLVAGIKISS